MNMLWNPSMPTAMGVDRSTVPRSSSAGTADAEARQTRAALQLTAQLSMAADALPHDVTERLRFGRMRALDVARARSGMVLPTERSAAASPRRTAGFVWSPWVFRLCAVAPLVTLVVGLVTIQQGHVDSQIVAAAEVDAALLADELPPAAYSDPGFSEFLRTDSAN